MSQNKTIELSNLQVYIVAKALEQIKLTGQPSFARRRFLREMNFFVGDIDAERKELITKYAEKKGDELQVNGNEYVFTAKNRKEYNRKFDDINNTKIQIDVTEANAGDIKQIGEILLNEANVITKDAGDKGLDASTFDYVEHLKEISSILKYE